VTTSDEQALQVGARLRSTACATEIIVVRAPAAPVALTCAGAPMIPLDPAVPGREDPGDELGALLGKRYADEALGLELLVTKAGRGPLALDGAPLEPKQAKPLPSSD
jgi:hypothetical protein